jgi:hypothetical protein
VSAPRLFPSRLQRRSPTAAVSLEGCVPDLGAQARPTSTPMSSRTVGHSHAGDPTPQSRSALPRHLHVWSGRGPCRGLLVSASWAARRHARPPAFSSLGSRREPSSKRLEVLDQISEFGVGEIELEHLLIVSDQVSRPSFIIWLAFLSVSPSSGLLLSCPDVGVFTPAAGMRACPRNRR